MEQVQKINDVGFVKKESHVVKLQKKSLWLDAFNRLKRDKLALISLFIVGAYALVALLVSLGVIASDWSEKVGPSYAAPTWDYILGTDIFGQSVFRKVLYGTKIAMSVGLVSSLIAIPIGVGLGAIAGYFGGKVDEFVVWLYTTVSSIPNIMLLMSIAFVLGKGSPLFILLLGQQAGFRCVALFVAK
jgi:ABC-type dipeptide/oligopeptide/nickel transport system permease subunit